MDIVRDLATHDLDIVGWLSAAPVSALAAQLCPHRESFVAIQGDLADGTVFTSVVDRLTSAKRRRVWVVGDGGTLVADTVGSTLTFFDSPSTPCAEVRTGPRAPAVRFDIERSEPLARQLDAWCNRLAGDARAPVVTLDEGLAVVVRAEAVLESAASGAVVRPWA